jgi:hypothetical protein
MERLQNQWKWVMRGSAQDTLARHRNRSMTLQEGGVTFSQIFTVAVLFLIGFLGIKFLAPWSDYLSLKAAMQASVNQAQVSTDAALVSAVLDKATRLKIPLDPEDVHLTRNGPGSVGLWAQYDVTLSFPLGFSHTQTFRPEVRSVR